MENKPDNWVVVKVAKDLYKVLAGWSGGYLDGDRWRLNSGISEVKEDGDYWLFISKSGSVYKCHKEGFMNEYEEKANAWQEATDNWVKLTLEKYDGYDINDLTQVFMRGPFAGWSERMVLELAMGMDDANKKVPRHK
jgi:hypothetical protein